MAGFLHGVETIEVQSGALTVNLVKTAVVGLVGTAASGPVNTPVLVTSEKDFAQFGVNVAGTTILDALTAIFAQKSTVVVVVNVLDPATHTEAVQNEVVTVGADGSFALAHAGVSNVVVQTTDGSLTYNTVNTAYTLDPVAGTGQALNPATSATGAGIPWTTNPAYPSLVHVSYSYADATQVQPSDLIGGVSLAAKRFGMRALLDSYALFGFYPKLLIAPVYACLNSVSTALGSLAEQMRATGFVDAPIGVTPQQAITGRGPMGDINFNVSGERTVLCYPHVKVYDTVTNTDVLRPLSAYAAGVQSKTDQEKGYWWSPSNKEILGIDGLERPIYSMINDPNSEANLLNGAGIMTVFNSYGTGLRLWGNRNASFPAASGPFTFISVRRTADIIEESIEYFTLQLVDRPIDNALIDTVLESINGFMRTLQSTGAVLDGRVWYSAANNSTTALQGGHIVFDYDFMPPPPAERITYRAKLNVNYLANLGKTA